ncbi:MAG: Rrf2 family transcriptional regulator [Planctomycetes bacterium]|nr:Rrf2 family transcriptional regulator [Planctomycetota bacterium]
MLTGTTELALRALIYLGLAAPAEPISPKRLADTLNCSPTYLGKTLGLLVKADILRSVRGARGGVVLARDPRTISLLAVTEACQGALIGDYCLSTAGRGLLAPCRFHQVMEDVHRQLVQTLSACSLADLLACPAPKLTRNGDANACRMKLDGVEGSGAVNTRPRRA